MQNRIESSEQYKDFYQKSIQDQNAYWAKIAETFTWKKKWDHVQSGDFNDLNVKWFEGAKLNITENCLDRHVQNNPDKIAIQWEPNDPSWAPLVLNYSSMCFTIISDTILVPHLP